MAGNVLVTGTSSGIGAASVERLARAGWVVFAGVRQMADGEALIERNWGDVRPVLLDVCDGDQIAGAISTIREAVGDRGLQGLVNNAGIGAGFGGPVEIIPLDDWRRQFEVNLFGTIAVTRAAFALVRAGRGRFIFMGSGSGRLSTPGLAPYAASKHALEALGESLRHELAATPLHVSVIEPGAIRTPMWDKMNTEVQRMTELLTVDGGADYRFLVPMSRAYMAEGAEKGLAADQVARIVERALTEARPRARYLVGSDAQMAGIISRIPDRLRERTIAFAIRRYVKNGNSLL